MWLPVRLALTFVAFGALVTSVLADTYQFTNGNGDNLYRTGANWTDTTTSATGTVPDLTATNLAQINNGSAVIYVAGPDLVIKNGGELEVTNGSFTQTSGAAYIQLNGNGTILVDGGTFNQGTSSSSPFNVTNAGNVLMVTAGTVNIASNHSFQLVQGLGYNQSGGTVNATGGETDFNTDTNTLSGGTLNATLITGVNGSGTNPDGTTKHVFNISGGALTLSSSNSGGIYGGGATQYINFTQGSTGTIEFLASTTDTIATVQGFISRSAIEFNDTPYSAATGYSNFTITTDSMGDVFLTAVTAVPEPGTFLAGGLLTFCALPVVRRRWERRTA